MKRVLKGASTEIYDDKADELLAEFRAMQAASDRAYEECGALSLRAEADQLWQASDKLCDRISEIKPTTLSDAIDQLQLASEWDNPDVVLVSVAGLREIAAREGQL